ncbi:MAG: ABC transporter ATP-binding protein [Pseudobutyrivibrio sp.]|nr:ABC transporter ATP-binding protein [Clostridia bacterium]MCF0130188.1 ABC transporter ATP-binding protein [Pseudobutyrivibrio sp.]
MISVNNLSMKYEKAKRYSLSNVSFEIGDGEMVGLIGKNGAGKSTLMKSICKFILPSEGEILLDGKNIKASDRCLDDVGILLEPVFFQYMSAYDNLAYYLKIHNKEQYIQEIDDVLNMVGLGKNRDQKPSDFSFGMKQRLGLALALVGHPKKLILDEPFVGLDPVGVKDLISILQEQVKNNKMQAIISSHQLYELNELCDRVLVLYNGELVFDGVPDFSQHLLVDLDKEYANGKDIAGVKALEDKKRVEVSMDTIDESLRQIMVDYKIIGVETKKNSLEQFFIE